LGHGFAAQPRDLATSRPERATRSGGMAAALHMSAIAYLRETSEAMSETYLDDCVTHACRIASLLLEEGAPPWIGRIRETTGNVHHPLTPLRFLGRRGPTWTTHYICCNGADAYDPIVGEPISVDEYALRVFGRPIPVMKVVEESDVAALTRAGTLRAHINHIGRELP